MKLRNTFLSPYGQYKHRNGERFIIVRKIHPNEYDFDECGPMYVIAFSEGEQIDAWPEEIFSGVESANPKTFLRDLAVAATL